MDFKKLSTKELVEYNDALQVSISVLNTKLENEQDIQEILSITSYIDVLTNINNGVKSYLNR